MISFIYMWNFVLRLFDVDTLNVTHKAICDISLHIYCSFILELKANMFVL